MSRESLQRIMKNLDAPNYFSEVQVNCPSCRKLHKFSAYDWMEAVDDDSIAIKCSCGQLVGIIRRQDNIRFVEGPPDFSAHLPADVHVALVDSSLGRSSKKPWWQVW